MSFSSSSSSGSVGQKSAFDSSGFNVNFGNGVSQGGGASTTTYVIAAVIILGALLWKRKR